LVIGKYMDLKDRPITTAPKSHVGPPV
jgi:hypothetical protein